MYRFFCCSFSLAECARFQWLPCNPNKCPTISLIYISVIKQDVSPSSVRVLKRCAFCSLSMFVRERSFSTPNRFNNRWICSCQVSLYCHKSMCSVLVIIPIPFLWPSPSLSLKFCLSVCVRSIWELAVIWEMIKPYVVLYKFCTIVCIK